MSATASTDPMNPYYIGLMSGTSMDGVDAVIVQFAPFRLIATYHEDTPADLREKALYYSTEATPPPEAIRFFDKVYGEFFATAVNALLQQSNLPSRAICAIGSHGQTLLHQPGGPQPFTLQVGDPQIIAQTTGICTISHFRQDDMAVGGQGAPLAPAFHAWFFRDPQTDVAVVNIGGIANISFIPSTGIVLGFDTGPGNSLLDAWNARHRGTPYDRDGHWGRSGQCSLPLLQRLLTEPFFQSPPPKSTGKDLFNLHWLTSHLSTMTESLPPEDVQATLVECTAITIAQALQSVMPQGLVYIAGGGAYNPCLVEAIQRHLGPIYLVTLSGARGLSPEWVEAVCFAWLARERLAARPGNLPSVTGARMAVPLGRITQPAN